MPSLFTQSRASCLSRNGNCAYRRGEAAVHKRRTGTDAGAGCTHARWCHGLTAAELATKLAPSLGGVARQADSQGVVSSNSPAMNLLALPAGSRTAKHGLYLVYVAWCQMLRRRPAFAEFDDESQQARARRTYAAAKRRDRRFQVIVTHATT